MNRFRSALASGEDWETCVHQCLAQLGDGDGETLGVIYWTDVLNTNAAEIISTLREATGIESWVGSVALGVCGSAGVHFDCPAISVMLGRFAADSFRTFAPIDSSPPRFAPEVRDWLAAHDSQLALVHGDQHSTAIDTIVESLSATMHGGFLVGGVGSSRAQCPQLADELVAGGLSGVMFSSEVEVMTRLSQGCSPIGELHTVTDSSSNIIMALDGRPALDVFKADIGEVLARDLSRVAGYIFAGLPIRGSDTREYLVRNLAGIDPNSGAVAIGDYISEGDQILFCRRDPQSAVEDMERMLGELSAALDGRRPAGGVYVSCLARGPNQFEPPDLELTLIEKHLGTFPLAGFFANGEISHDRLYAYTGVLTVFL